MVLMMMIGMTMARINPMLEPESYSVVLVPDMVDDKIGMPPSDEPEPVDEARAFATELELEAGGTEIAP